MGRRGSGLKIVRRVSRNAGREGERHSRRDLWSA